jgi:hypothetical protein
LVLAPSLFPHSLQLGTTKCSGWLNWPKVTGTHEGLHSGLRPRAPTSIITNVVCVYASMRLFGIPLARIITNLVEFRVMGITQCQGYSIGWNSG